MPQQDLSETELEAFRKKLRRRARRKDQAAPLARIYRRNEPEELRRPRPKAATLREPVSLADAVPGIETQIAGQGLAFVIEKRLDDRAEEWGMLCRRFHQSLSSDSSALRERLAASCPVHALLPEDVLFIDLETTGLSSTPVFLIGIMESDGGTLVLRQYFARTYAEEPAIVSATLDRMACKRLIVSFNGKSFDLPYLRMRAAAHRMDFPVAAEHFDLLHECRRIWKNSLPDCKLQTLESCICRRPRHDDIPGSEIPDAYHAFVRTGDASQMVEVLHHNRLDLITLADLMTRLPALTGRP